MKKKKVLLIIFIILFIYCIGGIMYGYFKPDNKINSVKSENIMEIKNYDYILYDNDLDIYKKEFKILKKNLESNNINYEEYASSISKLFVIDLYSLSVKNNVYDVGGVEFVYPEARDNYSLNVTNTLYKYMEDNSDGKREQKLPCVSDVIIKDITTSKYTINDKEYESYIVNVDINYVEDLEYDKSAEIILVKEDKYLYVVEKN